MQPTPPSRRSPIRRILVVGISLLLLCLAVAIIYDAPPPDTSDFQPEQPEVAPSENGFAIIEHLPVAFKDLADEDRSRIFELLSPSSHEWDPDLAQRILAADRSSLETLATALTKAQWHHPHDHFTTPPEFRALQPLANLKRIAAVHAFELGRPQQGIAHLSDLYTLADAVSHANLAMIGELLHLSIESLAANTIARIAPEITDPDTLTALHDLVVENPPNPESWNHALRSEYVFIRDATNDLGRWGSGSPLGQLSLLQSLSYKPNLTLQKILHVYRESATNPLAPTYAARSTTAIVGLPSTLDDWTNYLSLNYSGEIVAAEMAASVNEIESRTWLAHIHHTRSLLLIALHHHQLEHENQLPASLAELVPTYLPELPLDPYDGSPLKYDPTRRLFWFVGENLTDGGGRLDQDNSRIDRENPTFHIPEPVAP